jgi:cyclase
VIACLDVDGGRVVKGVRFQALKDMGDPVELATHYGAEGADEITFLDISATLERRATLHETVRRTAEELFVPLTVGGGLKSVEDARVLLRSGADKVAINTAAVATPRLITQLSDEYGAQCVVVAVDAKRYDDGWRVHTHAGKKDTGLQVVPWCQEAARLGAGEILLTSIDADGTRQGYDVALTRRVSEAVSVPVVASGGCGKAAHAVAALTEGAADAALVAGIFHDGLTTPKAFKQELGAAGVEVRP